MLNNDEKRACEKVNKILQRLKQSQFICEERKATKGESVIDKPVDLQIKRLKNEKIVAVIELANVNTTQLVNECCRLYFDKCPRKLLILGARNVPNDAVKQCNRLLARLYGQEDIQDTPARVVKYGDDSQIELSLKELLLI